MKEAMGPIALIGTLLLSMWLVRQGNGEVVPGQTEPKRSDFPIWGAIALVPIGLLAVLGEAAMKSGQLPGVLLAFGFSIAAVAWAGTRNSES